MRFMAVLDFLEAVVKRLVADVGTFAARFETLAMQLVVVVMGLLASSTLRSQQSCAANAHTHCA